MTLTEVMPPADPDYPSSKPSWSMASVLFLLIACASLPFATGRWLNPYAGFVGPLTLLLLIRSMSPKKGLLFGYCIFVLSLFVAWITTNKVVSGPLIVAGGAMAGMIYFLPYLADRILRDEKAPFRTTLILPFAWVAVESVFSLAIADIASISNSQYLNRPLLQIASLFGEAGVSFVLIWGIAILSWCFENRNQRRNFATGLGIFSLLVATVFGFGFLRMAVTVPATDQVRVALVRLPMDFGLIERLRNRPNDQTALNELIERKNELLRLTSKAANLGAKAVLWSEVAGLTFDAEADSNATNNEREFLESAKQVARLNKIYLFAAFGFNRSNSLLADNHVVVFSPNGAPLISYRKSNLSPGEKSILGDGKIPIVVSEFGRWGVSICADFNFSRFIRQAGVSNIDMMFDSASEWPEIANLQSATDVFRAVENGSNLVKSASGGDSLVVDFTGRILTRNDSDNLTVSDIRTKGRSTVYSLWGWLFGPIIMCMFFVIVWIFRSRFIDFFRLTR